MVGFRKALTSLQDAIYLAIRNKIDLNRELDKEKALYDYNEKQRMYYLGNLRINLQLVKSTSLELFRLSKYDIKNQPIINSILELIPELDSNDLNKIDKTVKQIIKLTKQLNFPKENTKKEFMLPLNVPEEISSEIRADFSELNKCFNNACYRSSVILCGRLLEVALHRKYYEFTGNDLLEKSPGIGLGNLIAKLKEKNVRLDPAITNQIHLINQVRINSVHRKKDAFYPTKAQTQAIILYTIDLLEKLFK